VTPAAEESALAAVMRPESQANASGAIGVYLTEREDLRHYNIRGRPEEASFAAAVKAHLELPLPDAPNRYVRNADSVLAWLGPDEWLLSGTESIDSRVVSLRSDLEPHRHAVTDLSSGLVAIQVKGYEAQQVFAKGCTLNLDEAHFASGQCAQTLLAKATVVLICSESADASTREFEIVVRRSLADYLWRWLRDSATEYGFEVDAP
jgi:sarcosine oxidase subunit gamma